MAFNDAVGLHNRLAESVIRTTKDRPQIMSILSYSHLYKIQFVQELKPNDHQVGRTFSAEIHNEVTIARDFLISEEIHFGFNGYVRPLHPFWCVLWAQVIIDPNFFESKGLGRAMTFDFFVSDLEGVYMGDL